MLSGHRIKSYNLIKCDKLYLMTDVNDIFTIVIFHAIESSYVIGINSISTQQ
jgi:hypothetical protein